MFIQNQQIKNKNMKHKFKENEAIHCETKEEFKAIKKMAHKQGFKWADGNKFTKDTKSWNVYEENTVLNVKEGYCHRIDTLSPSYQLIKASDILNSIPTLKEVKEHFKYAKIVTCLYDGKEYNINENIIRDIHLHHEKEYWIDLEINSINLWGKERGYAEIVENINSVVYNIDVSGFKIVSSEPKNNKTYSFEAETVGGVKIRLTGGNLDNIQSVAKVLEKKDLI